MSRIASLARIAGALGVAAALVGTVLGTAPATADTITRAAVTIDAREPTAPTLEMDLTWTAEGGAPRTSLPLHFAPAVDVTGVEIDGQETKVGRRALNGGQVVAWDVRLSSPLPAGESRSLKLRAKIASGETPGLRVDAEGGALLPGTGWFPSCRPEGYELLASSLRLRLPEGWTGVGAGTAAAPGGPWATRTPVRPFAVWGKYEVVSVEGSPPFTALRRPGRSGEPPRVDRVRALLEALETGVGPAVGEDRWTLVDLGGDEFSGGARTLFWNEELVAAADPGPPAERMDRALAVALAESFWTDWMRFEGDYAAWLAGSFPKYLGDAAVIALDSHDDRTPVERRLIGSRRDALRKGLAEDRALRGLRLGDPGNAWALETRGALVVHLMASSTSSPSSWMGFLNDFRVAHDGLFVDWDAMRTILDKRFPNQMAYLPSFLDGTDLPDFRIASHGPSEGRFKGRYRVEVENLGAFDCPVDVAIYTAAGNPLRNFRAVVPAGGKRAVLFRDAARLGRIEVDPRGIVPQANLEDELVVLKTPDQADPNEEPYVPSFVFSTKNSDTAEVSNFAIDFGSGVQLSEFSGFIQWYGTHHGPSGASLMGEGRITLAPDGEFADSFREAIGRESMYFDAREMWIRFPLAMWDEMTPLFDRATNAHTEKLSKRNRWIHQFSFPTYFFEESRATVPPPGAALICFGLGGEERRGLVVEPQSDGTRKMRLWDHRRGQTIWEATH